MNTLKTTVALLSGLSLLAASQLANAETIRVGIGTQDTTINCATGGLLIRELHLLEKYLPKDGKYKDVQYDIVWKNFTSGAPLTSEMVAGRLDFGAMADFPGVNNAAAFKKSGKESIFLTVLSGSVKGSGNGIVVPIGSDIQNIKDLKGKTISVPFASTAHGLLLRAITGQGLDPKKDVNIIAQAPEVAGPALQSNKIDAHADFVPFAELFPYRGIARKIFDGSQAGVPTFHGALVSKEYAEKYPEIVNAYLKASIEADRLIRQEPEKYSEIISKVTGIEPEVVYLFHGPLGLQTRDFTWKPEYRHATQIATNTLKLLGRTDINLNVDQFIQDSYIRKAFADSGLKYDVQLKNYVQSPLVANDALTKQPIKTYERVTQIWVTGEPKVRHYNSPENAFRDLKALQKIGKTIRVVYAQDRNSGIKLFAKAAWFATDKKGQISSFLQRSNADQWAQANGGKVYDFANAQKLVR
jgi:NitT/TauT family transport system substrate-binding protein